MTGDDRATWWEKAIDGVETLGALVACGGIATLPYQVARLFPGHGVVVFVVTFVGIVIAPALLPLRAQPGLDAGQRWGTRMGRLLGWPLRVAARRRAARRHRALGAVTSTSSTASPSLSSLPPGR